MKFLLCSSGISNPSIHDALVELLGKPVAESSALCIPTGVQPFPGGSSHVYRFISGATRSPMLPSLLPETVYGDAMVATPDFGGATYDESDDETAIKVVDGTVGVVSEGHWMELTANESR